MTEKKSRCFRAVEGQLRLKLFGRNKFLLNFAPPDHLQPRLSDLLEKRALAIQRPRISVPRRKPNRPTSTREFRQHRSHRQGCPAPPPRKPLLFGEFPGNRGEVAGAKQLSPEGSRNRPDLHNLLRFKYLRELRRITGRNGQFFSPGPPAKAQAVSGVASHFPRGSSPSLARVSSAT